MQRGVITLQSNLCCPYSCRVGGGIKHRYELLGIPACRLYTSLIIKIERACTVITKTIYCVLLITLSIAGCAPTPDKNNIFEQQLLRYEGARDFPEMKDALFAKLDSQFEQGSNPDSLLDFLRKNGARCTKTDRLESNADVVCFYKYKEFFGHVSWRIHIRTINETITELSVFVGQVSL